VSVFALLFLVYDGSEWVTILRALNIQLGEELFGNIKVLDFIIYFYNGRIDD